MTVAHTTALELLGKTVSFEYVRHLQLTEQSSIVFREKIVWCYYFCCYQFEL